MIRVARTYLSTEALERCSAAGTVPFVLKMAKSEISQVGGAMNKVHNLYLPCVCDDFDRILQQNIRNDVQAYFLYLKLKS